MFFVLDTIPVEDYIENTGNLTLVIIINIIRAFIPGRLFSFPGILELIFSFWGTVTVTGIPEEI